MGEKIIIFHGVFRGRQKNGRKMTKKWSKMVENFWSKKFGRKNDQKMIKNGGKFWSKNFWSKNDEKIVKNGRRVLDNF